MAKIKVVGLGPGDMGSLTLETLELLKKGPTVLRTEIHPCVQALKEQGVEYESFDSLYQEEENFDRLYEKIADLLIERVRKTDEDLIYAVPGNPMFAEKTVEILCARAKKGEIGLRIYPAVSFVDTVLTALEYDPNEGLHITDAFKVIRDGISGEMIDPGCAILITQVYSPLIAGDLKIALSKFYSDEESVTLVYHAGLRDEEIKEIALYELDRQPVDHLTSLFIPAKKENYRALSAFDRIMRRLLAPDGCPWDREQTHESLRPCMIEEAYEAVDAIEKEDYENLQEELGDLLLQIVFHALLAEKEGYFNLEDVIEGVSEKMIRRHPHVFGDARAENADEVLVSWEEIKKQEKKSSASVSEEMRKVPGSYTGLMQAEKIQKKARSEGFDWDDPKPALEKVIEEVHEVEEALDDPSRPDQIEEELGDLLFAAANAVRLSGAYSEDVLKKANEKFIRRYEKMEELSRKDGVDFKSLSLEEQDEYWKRAKKEGSR